jgi:hypothetical protein
VTAVDSNKLALAVAVAALVPSIYSGALPPLATVQGRDDAPHIAQAEKVAMAVSGAIVGTVAVVAGSGEVLVLGGAMAAAYALLYRNARRAPGTASE